MAATCGLSVIEEQQELRGYQIYIVEQWVCNRKIDSNVVKVFTGDENHVIQVAVIAISTAELQQPRPQIQAFLNVGSHLKYKPTPLGEISLTNPGELPFDMDMVLVPDGDYDKWIKRTYVNINLRRANCTGRSSLNLRPPNPASEEKFRSLYRIADTAKFEDAVINLVSLVQIALYLFDLLHRDYIDGLICDETTAAFWEFYTKYDPVKTTEFSLKEPWMEPHLLAAIISKLLMCRNKLQDYNFTTIKDPFLDYDSFRADIGDYQRHKNIQITRLINLETLAKLNEHTSSQLKVKKVIKSKLDDISGITNSPLFSETSDPETFRHHATIESLRTIWRPRLKGSSHHSTDQQSNELLHMIKGVSRTGGAAVDMLSRVAGSIPWISTADTGKKDTNRSPTLGGSSPSSSHMNADSLMVASPQRTSYQGDQEDELGFRTVTPSRKPSPLSLQKSPSFSSTPNTPHLMHQDSTSPLSAISSTNSSSTKQLNHQDIPSYVQSTNMMPISPGLRISRSSETTSSHPDSTTPSTTSTKHTRQTEGDFVPYKPNRSAIRHTRSVSDSILLSSLFTKTLTNEPEDRVTALQSPFDQYESSLKTRRRSQTALDIIPKIDTKPVTKINVQTYLAYEQLCQQQRMLQQAYQEIKSLADTYEKTANELKNLYEARSQQFEIVQKDSRHVMDDQNETERRLKDVEDNSAKIHYELKVMNDKLKDIEDNVGTFYGKVDLLEQKMDDSQQSITTMLIIGNYFNHYWLKVVEWVQWLGFIQQNKVKDN
ncbi:Protein STB2 [Choanephora cucurbitarum]|uniref:Protein STB2 n=1 Tax=Choanephora cucurbitarum TaxID=101091 RepID=A0A1C7NLB2_9FUNG|nr:Protein STB2 [Choanephora cucurbitarum]